MSEFNLKDLAHHLSKRGCRVMGISPSSPPLKAAKAEKIPRGMNKTEQAYAAHLSLRKLAGEIADYRFELYRIRLANGAWFKPDFVVVLNDGAEEIHEVKGHWREAARVRIKVAAELVYWKKFVAVKKAGGTWEYELFY